MPAVFGMLGTFGPVFSFEPLKPQFDHINPAKGLQKILSLRNVIEFTKGLAKVVFLASLFVLILTAWLQPLFDAPGCGSSCLEPVVQAMLTPFGVAAALAFVVIGLIDVPIQRWLFLRDMRMTTTEYRREHKDLEGDPLIRHEQRRQRREAVMQPARLGVVNAVIVFVSGDRAVALRYIKGETPVPTIVGKGRDHAASEMVAQARQARCRRSCPRQNTLRADECWILYRPGGVLAGGSPPCPTRAHLKAIKGRRREQLAMRIAVPFLMCDRISEMSAFR
ncbi:EscU/YscU/HrcU family type III secretion system export apparatus switch protein [Mesorhizobium sp. WSM3860]|uniref:EscU/YscU/HrcU family type III secretion system export apparatus switch protein n=1 Tax=Mesorhizobium sp. WSM3860 TaxID=2029403 RepID=UPI000BB08E15|nr:EscU/YscU/HrcU family type III secretion system export apparatus switch protein [Mesorhizobium sp. WSM3860]PBC01389.1 hypothetical protein CK220_26505 [Mesorhizobium sp. WSM3860]